MLEALGEAAFRTLLLAGVVQSGLWLFRIRRAQLLLLAWTVILAASLAMPALQWATPLRLPVFPGLASASLTGAADPQLPSSALEAPGPAPAVIQDPSTMRPLLGVVYFLVSSVLLLRLAVGVALSMRLLVKAAPMRPDPACMDRAAKADVRISRSIAAPVTVANVILLPADAVHWPPAMRQAVLAHERAHVERWDFAVLLASQVNRALFWFSPLSWWLHRRLAVLAEFASDDQAMAVTGDQRGYAGILLEMGRRSGPLLRGLAMARPATLQHRIERVLSGRVQPRPVTRMQRVVLAAGAASLSIASASPQPDPGASPGVVASAEQREAEGALEPAALPPPTGTAASLPPQPLLPASPPAPSSSPQPAPAVLRGMARPMPRRVSRNTAAMLPSRTTRPNRAINDEGAFETPLQAQTVNPAAAPALNNQRLDVASSMTSSGAGGNGHVPPLPRRISSHSSEPPLLKQIDDQTCTGAYLPGPIGARLDSSWLNLVKAKFFREADGRPWLTLYVDAQTPVTLPVTVKGNEVEFTGSRNTVFTVLPKGMNHLTGTTQRPYGTVDFACGGSNAHLFDGAG